MIILEDDKRLTINIEYGKVKTEFSGLPESVLISINKFISKEIPNINLASKISINYSVKELIDKFSEYIKITPEGPRVWISNRKLSDKDIVCLQLIAARIGYLTGNLESASLTLQEIINSTNLKPKSISSRLSEVCKVGYVEREQTDQAAKYKITTQGIYWIIEILEKKIGALT
jgi:predicted transcriptional regulator